MDGSSPVLAIACEVCGAAVGFYCRKPNGDAQIIAHKRRRETYWKKAREAAAELVADKAGDGTDGGRR